MLLSAHQSTFQRGPLIVLGYLQGIHLILTDLFAAFHLHGRVLIYTKSSQLVFQFLNPSASEAIVDHCLFLVLAATR